MATLEPEALQTVEAHGAVSRDHGRDGAPAPAAGRLPDHDHVMGRRTVPRSVSIDFAPRTGRRPLQPPHLFRSIGCAASHHPRSTFRP